MTRNDLTRIVLEGALNGIGFVIGTAILSGIVSFIFLHIFAVIILPLIGIVLWFSFKGRRMLKDRLERMRVEPLPPGYRAAVSPSPKPASARADLGAPVGHRHQRK